MNEFVTVLSAEIMRRIRSRPFLIGVALGIFAIALMIKAPALLGGALTHAGDSIVLAGPPALTSRASQLLAKDFEIEATTTKTDTPSIAYLDAHKKAGALVVLGERNKQLSVTVYARNLSFVNRKTLKTDLMPLNLALATSGNMKAIDSSMNVPIVVHGIDSKFSNEQASDAAQAIAYTLLFFLYISILINSQLVMTSVAEEKTSRIAELLIASVNPSALLGREDCSRGGSRDPANGVMAGGRLSAHRRRWFRFCRRTIRVPSTLPPPGLRHLRPASRSWTLLRSSPTSFSVTCNSRPCLQRSHR